MSDVPESVVESIRVRDGVVLDRLRALHNASWWSAQVLGRPKSDLMRLLLREIEDLEDAPFQQTRAEIRAVHFEGRSHEAV